MTISWTYTRDETCLKYLEFLEYLKWKDRGSRSCSQAPVWKHVWRAKLQLRPVELESSTYIHTLHGRKLWDLQKKREMRSKI